MNVAGKRMDDYFYVVFTIILLSLLTASCKTMKAGRPYPYPGVLTDPVTSNVVVRPR